MNLGFISPFIVVDKQKKSYKCLSESGELLAVDNSQITEGCSSGHLGKEKAMEVAPILSWAHCVDSTD